MIQTQFDFDATERREIQLIAQGNERRDVGMALAAARRPDRVTLGRLALVRALLESPDGTATIDDATNVSDLETGFADGGKWRGTVTRSLVADGLAEFVGTTRSRRPSRHRGYVALLRLRDRNDAQSYLRRLTAALNDATPQGATCGAAENIVTPHAKENSNATI